MQDPKLNTRKEDFELEFCVLLDRIANSEWKKALNLALKNYNIKLFNVEKLSPKKVKELYQQLVDRFYRNGLESEAWHENELRLFVWVLVTYSNVERRPICEFTTENWLYLSHIFHGKNPLLCEFQYMNIRRTQAKTEAWSQEEDNLVLKIIGLQTEKNRWNQVAKLHYYESEKRFFRTAKQCRERWNNYLDPSKTKGSWSQDEDITLINAVVTEGKKWAFIAKQLDGRRTEHMVKNRFKSLVTRFSKFFKEKRCVSEHDVLDLILRKYASQGKLLLGFQRHGPVKLEQQESDAHALPQGPLNSASIDSTQQADFDVKAAPSPVLPALLDEFQSDHVQYLNRCELQLVEDRCDFIGHGFGRHDVEYFDDDHNFV